MRIWLKPEIMAQYHLMPTDISTALAEQNIEAAPGSLGERGNQTFQYTLKYKGRLQSQEEFENIVIRATADGEVLRLKDVANVELGRLTYNFVNKVNGHSAVTCIVYQMAGTNATETINNIALPAGIPIIAGEEGICSGCGVATLSISYYDIGYTAGQMAYDILVNGADITTMEIKTAPQVTKEYNADICSQLGITPPDDYVAIETE